MGLADFSKHWKLYGSGERNGEGGADPKGAFDGNGSAVRLRDVLDDGEAEAGAALLATTAFVDSIEPLKKTAQLFRFDAITLIDDRKDHSPPCFV